MARGANEVSGMADLVFRNEDGFEEGFANFLNLL